MAPLARHMVAVAFLAAIFSPALGETVRLENPALRLEYDTLGKGPLVACNRATGHTLQLTAASPRFEFQEGVVGGSGLQPEKVSTRRVAGGQELQLLYPEQTVGKVGVVVTACFFVPDRGALLRKHAELTLRGAPGQTLGLLKVTLLDEPLSGKNRRRVERQIGAKLPGVQQRAFLWRGVSGRQRDGEQRPCGAVAHARQGAAGERSLPQPRCGDRLLPPRPGKTGIPGLYRRAAAGEPIPCKLLQLVDVVGAVHRTGNPRHYPHAGHELLSSLRPYVRQFYD